ncbi:MAG: molecular chaperone DnaJ [Candidatus Kerfeldbacteria bacterium]|nr:molecular chaperone DnaJ [Candidatus Kerfeldbacteria bacterium]
MADDYYQLLGIGRTASAEEIKKAFRTKAHQYHPDKSTGDAEQFKKINEAYQVLGDSAKRQQYDQYGQTFDQTRRQGGAAPGGFGDFGQAQWSNVNVDFGNLGDIFGDMFGFGSRTSGRQAPTRGQDIQADLRIPFRTSIFGGQETIQLRHHVVCPRCGGQGAEPGTSTKTCDTCKGQGQVQQTRQTILGAMQSVEVCPTCNGQGQIITTPCHECDGQGRKQETEPITVKIPPGIASGQRIKLSGKGEAGTHGVVPGDLYLVVHVAPDPQFTRQGDDIVSTMEIPFTTTALGGQAAVETVHGPVTLKIPTGTPSGKTFILRSKGVAKLRGRGHGDHRVTITITTPTHLSAKTKKILKELQDEGL